MVKWVGVEELLPLFFLCAGVLQQVRTYDRVRANSPYNTDTNFDSKKGENCLYHRMQEKNGQQIDLLCWMLIMCTTQFSPLLAAYRLILIHPQGKKLQALLHLCHTCWSLKVCEFTWTEYKSPYSYHPSFPPQSDKKFFMCHSEYGEAEHKCTWRDVKQTIAEIRAQKF